MKDIKEIVVPDLSYFGDTYYEITDIARTASWARTS